MITFVQVPVVGQIRRMGQGPDVTILPSTTALPPGVQPPAPKPAFIDSALVSTATDAAAAVSSGILASIYGKAKSRWATFFWVVAAVAGFKGLVDLSRVRER